MSEIKVSIIIPVYNAENYLRVCLDSVCTQTLEGIEAIVVDDGSTDGSAGILEEYKTEHPELFHIYRVENQGTSHARNYGLSKASGEYILFADSDDLLSYNMCEMLYEKAVQDNDDVVLCRYYDMRERPLTKRLYRTKSKAYMVSYETDFNVHERKFQLTHISPFPWDKLFRRSLIEKYPFPQGIRFEDLAIMYPVLCEAQQVGVLTQHLYNYRRASEGSFLNTLSERTLDIIKALSQMVESLKANGHFSEFYEEVEYICIRHILERFNNMFDDRRKGALSPENRGKLELKMALVSESMDFLEKNFKNWQNNRYLKYSASARTREMLPLYRSKKKMLLWLRIREKAPLKLLRVRMKGKLWWRKRKAAFQGFWKKKHKLRYLKSKIPLFKLFSLPRDVEYTKYYLKYPVSEGDVLFESKHGDDVAGNMFAMIKAMGEEQFRKLSVSLALKEDLIELWRQKFLRYGIDYVHIIPFGEKEYLKALATAKYLVTDTSLPSYYIKRPEQIYLNTWHGTPLKAMGRIVPQREYALGNIQRNFLIADYLLYQNEFSRDVFLDDYMIRELYNGKVMLSGYPRNSAFFETERYAVIRDEMELGEAQVIVYMPTWRGLLFKKENKKQIAQISDYLHELDAGLDDNQVMFVKLHPYVKEGMDYDDFDHIRPFPEQYETYDFLNATDMLITDYSSIMFDYAVSGKKIVLFTYDKESYLSDRGMYADLDSFGFPQADNVESLLERINEDAPADYGEFQKKYCPYDSADTARRVCECVFLGKEPNFLVESVEHNGKENVLVMINGLAKDKATNKRLKRYNAFDSEHYNFYYCMKDQNVKGASAKLAMLDKKQFYMPLQFDVNYTIKSRIACFFAFGLNWYGSLTDRAINAQAKIEKQKYFHTAPFHYVVNISNRDRLMHHIIGCFSVPKVYNFLGYKDVLYHEKRKYRKNVSYVAKHLTIYDYIVCNKEIEGLPCKAIREERVNLIFVEGNLFDMDFVLAKVKGEEPEEKHFLESEPSEESES